MLFRKNLSADIKLKLKKDGIPELRLFKHKTQHGISVSSLWITKRLAKNPYGLSKLSCSIVAIIKFT